MKNLNFLTNWWCSGKTKHVITTLKPRQSQVNATWRFVAILTMLVTLGVGNVWGGDKYKLVKDASTLADGDKIIIVNTAGDYAISTTQNGNNRAATAVTATSEEIEPGADVSIITLGKDGDNWTFYAPGTETSGYLYAASSSKNYLRTQTTNDNNGKWSVSIKADGEATITAQGTNTHNIMRYNPNNGSPMFSCYEGTTGTAVSIYKKAASVTHTVTWNDNGGQIKSEEIAEGSTSYSCPSAPSTSARGNCGDKFMGWTTTASYTGNTPPAVLFTDDSGTKPAINSNTDFYAVFADEE